MTTANTSPHLFVDLDGSLVRTDLLIESFFGLLKLNLLYLFCIPFWLLRGKAHMKQMIADRVEIDVTLLPYQQDFLAFLQQESKNGRKIYLATASNEKYATQIFEHLGFFKGVIASNATTNMSGTNKLRAIRDVVGNDPFEYAGNAWVDMKIWPHCSSCILVNPDRKTKRAANKQFSVSHTFSDDIGGIRHYLKAIRVHQWIKNVLLFLPLLAAHQVSDTARVVDVFFAFIAFSFCASSVYLLNDLLDLSVDRVHATKNKRPFASGTIPIINGVLLIPVLLVSSAFIALSLSLDFMLALALYYTITLAYSLALKRIVMVDILVLAGLYAMRVIAGAAASDTPLSFWILAFSMFIFLSLAIAKRSSELVTLREDNKVSTAGRGYRVLDLEFLHSMGISSGYMSVLVMALYINSEAVTAYYTYPEIIWLVCPILLYWISRVWLKTGRGEMPDGPIVFAVKDRQSQFIGILVILIVVIAAAIN